MTSPAARLSLDYTPTFLVYLNHPDEHTMHTAYELGRTAFADRISLLDVIRIHHRVVGEVLQATANAQDLPVMVNAAAGFGAEAVAHGVPQKSNPGTSVSRGDQHSPSIGLVNDPDDDLARCANLTIFSGDFGHSGGHHGQPKSVGRAPRPPGTHPWADEP
jgi:hypothetical protein